MAKFKTRARAIDMLGRQQIAGIPTAISELFKNAHDAYADHVDVDYFRKDKLFILRDDGLGMTKDDFENRWLVIGTESKFDNKRILPPPIDLSKPIRPIMGEKGIGRLAISAIGKQVLILSRAKRDEELQPLVGAFINWGIFEIPGLDIEDVLIPIKIFDLEVVPSVNEIESMKDELLDSILVLRKKGILLENEYESLSSEIRSFNVDIEKLDKSLPGNLSIKDASGTHFYISPVSEGLNSDIDVNLIEKDRYSKLEKFLIGFTNTMTPDHPRPNIEASFRDYRGDDSIYFDLIDKESFFTPDEFQKADHHFYGEFNEYGQFTGKVKIYNKLEFDHKIHWSGNNMRLTSCGPFSIQVSYLQGDKKQSYLDPITWSVLLNKLNRFGGLYIYKDGIRILPYGNNDYDFLDIEKNRTKSAGYYFFSYRRMFGVINISRKNNQNLIEKAGREGFIENKAYKQIQDILRNFFVQLAADFFREISPGVYTEFWLNLRSEREKFYEAKERREKNVKERKRKFTNELNLFFNKLQEKEFEKKIDTIISESDKKFASVASIDDPDEASQTLINYEIEARKQIIFLKNETKLSAPRGFTISQETKRDWEAYLDKYSEIEETIFSKAEEDISKLLDKYREELHLKVSKRKRIEMALEQISIEAKDITRKKRDEAKNLTEEISGKVKDLTQELMSSLEQKIREVQIGLATFKLENENDPNIYEELKRLEAPIVQESEYANTILEGIINQLDSIYWEKDNSGKIITNKQIEESQEQEIGELKEKLTNDAELTQLGLAINIVHHEFNSTVKSMRHNIRDLKRWADVDEKFTNIYNNIRVNFEHLDGYISLLTPFNRRLNKTEELIEAEDIYFFLHDVFRGRLERHDIKLVQTNLFKATKVKGYRSVFYPTFVNVVDNAIHWLKEKEDQSEKIIRLHADNEGSFYISNNGPGVKISDKDKIFELGFTRKLSGRGMGLAISKEVLNGVDYDLILDEPRKESTVTFKVFRK
ncbi:MAG: ATP-binding protein [Bacteroidales bacterium]|nr:ATP-binding protein [Bacteroidales bacterium]